MSRCLGLAWSSHLHRLLERLSWQNTMPPSSEPQGAQVSSGQSSDPRELEAPQPHTQALTLHVPGPPDGVVEPDFVSPLEL